MRNTILILAFSVFITTLGLGIISPLISVYSENLGASGLWIGIIFGSFALSRIFVVPIVGKYSDRKGRKKLILAGLVCYTLTSFGYVLVRDLPQLLLIRIFHGIGSSMVLPIALAYAGDIAKRGEEGKTMSSYSMAQFLGHGSGPLLGGVVTEAFGMDNAFVAMGLLSAVSLAFVFFLLPESANHVPKEVSLRRLLRETQIKALMYSRLFRSLGRSVIMSFLPLFALSKGLSISQTGIVISAMLILTAMMQKPVSRLADIHDRKKLITIGNVSTAVIFFLMPFSRNFSDILLLMVLMGLSDSLEMATATALTASIGRKFGMGSTTSLSTTAMSVGFGVAPIIAGLITDSIGLQYVFYFGSLSAIAGSLLFNKMIDK